MEILMQNYLKDSERILASAGWATRSPKCGAEYEATDTEIRDMIKYAKEMKLSSVLDIPFFVFSIKDVSRSFTHQWVRYRIAAHMQQSLRFVDIDTKKSDWFVVPPSVSSRGAESISLYVKNQQNVAKSYKELIGNGVPVEDARFALPIGTKTHITTAMNCEELLHVFDQRCCVDAQWEIRNASFALMAAGLVISPVLFENSGPFCISDNTCRGSKKGSCKSYAEDMVEKIKKAAEERSKEFESMESGWLEMDLTDVLGYSAPEDLSKKVNEILGQEVDLNVPVIVKIKKH